MSEKWPFLETTEFNPFLETSRELVSSRAVSSSEGGKSSFSFDDHLSALSLLIGITNLLPLGSKHGNYNGPSQLPSVIDDRSILKPQAECVNIQQSKRRS